MGLKEDLIDALYEEGVLRSKEPLPTEQGYHCMSCSCPECRNPEETCACQNNDILEVIEKVFSQPSED